MSRLLRRGWGYIVRQATIVVLAAVGFSLGGCVVDGGPLGPLGYSTAEMRRAAADAKCRELGFKTATEAYGNCRLQLEQIRATKQAAAASEDAASAARRPSTQTYMDAKTAKLTTCTGSGYARTCM